jgi:DNA-binding MarR family transcriptional regulator
LIGLTSGDLITHLRKLQEAGYIETEKSGTGAASLTTITLTRSGRKALDVYTLRRAIFSMACRSLDCPRRIRLESTS